MPDFSELHPRRFFLETWVRIDNEAAAAREARAQAGLGYDWRPLVVFVTAAIMLTLRRYWGKGSVMPKVVRWLAGGDSTEGVAGFILHSRWERLFELAWWSGWRALAYLIVPLMLVWLWRKRPADFGLTLEGAGEHVWIYVGAYVAFLFILVPISFSPTFYNHYPFYDEARFSWLDFGLWELLYILQFLSLEFFFRGFLLHSTKDQLGSHAIFVAVIPYVMIHYGKPMPEALAATFAGIFLGTLSLRSGSIWNGFLIHVSVAVTMDLLGLWHRGHIPAGFWP